MEYMVDFLAGGAYGFTSVVVGQPLDTIKTKMAVDNRTMMQVTRRLVETEGLRGLYRGGTPIFLGGTLFRSAQFGVYSNALSVIHQQVGKPEKRWAGFFDPTVFVAGIMGGLGRGVVEAPFEFIKVRRQVDQPWKFSELYKGSGITIFRNAFLFCAFMMYVDFSKQIFPADPKTGKGALSPFLTGGICSNLAWLTIWPLDVVKSRVQSGLYEGKSTFSVFMQVMQSGAKDGWFRGLVPGLARSFLANGFSMIAYDHVKKSLEEEFALK